MYFLVYYFPLAIVCTYLLLLVISTKIQWETLKFKNSFFLVTALKTIVQFMSFIVDIMYTMYSLHNYTCTSSEMKFVFMYCDYICKHSLYYYSGGRTPAHVSS